jgi:hypothetical protein
MSLHFEGIARIGLVTSFLALACSNSDAPGGGGSGGGTSGSAGTSAGASASGASSGGAGGSGMAGSGTAGSSAGSSAAGSSSTGGSAGAGSGGTAGSAGSGSGGAKSTTTFFVTSDTSKTGNLGGLDGADMRCQTLATAAGFGDHTFKAYLSTSTVNAKDRIGTGPWVNSKGVTLAADVVALHALKGNADLFIDEKGMKINGQWPESPQPVEHDILTGSTPQGTVLANMTCKDWTSDMAADKAQVGHSDGLGPDGDTGNGRDSWSSAHENQDCSSTAPKGGAGKIYCFAID